jgi:hypothetical protein
MIHVQANPLAQHRRRPDEALRLSGKQARKDRGQTQ